MRKIVLPVDFSPLSRVAAGYASRLAEVFGGEVHALHIVQADTRVAPLPEHGAAITVSPQPALDSAEQRLADFVAQHLATVRTERHVLCGVPAIDIALEAERIGADLIVMGTGAEGMVKRLVFGSVSKSVLESAPCAVLLVPPAATEP